jgi:hypothetical protein
VQVGVQARTGLHGARLGAPAAPVHGGGMATRAVACRSVQ